MLDYSRHPKLWRFRRLFPVRYVVEFSRYADGGVSDYWMWWQWGKHEWGQCMIPVERD